MKLMSITGVALGLICMTGCMSINEKVVSAPHCSKTQTVFEPTVVVGEKIAGTASGVSVLGLFWFGPSNFADGVAYNNGQVNFGFDRSAKVKSAAAYNAIKRSQADILVGPTYIVENNDYFFFSKQKVTVSAYEGKIMNVSQIKSDK